MIAISMPSTSLRYSLRDKLTLRGMYKLFYIFVRHHGFTRVRNFLRYLRQLEREVDLTEDGAYFALILLPEAAGRLPLEAA